MLEQAKKQISDVKNASKGNIFSSWTKGIKNIVPQLNRTSGVTLKIKNQIKQMSSGVKQGLGNVLKYAGALFSLRSIYSVLSSSANSWLSSSNTQAQQLSANIEYMKYAMRKCVCSSYTDSNKFSIPVNESNTEYSICI